MNTVELEDIKYVDYSHTIGGSKKDKVIMDDISKKVDFKFKDSIKLEPSPIEFRQLYRMISGLKSFDCRGVFHADQDGNLELKISQLLTFNLKISFALLGYYGNCGNLKLTVPVNSLLHVFTEIKKAKLVPDLAIYIQNNYPLGITAGGAEYIIAPVGEI